MTDTVALSTDETDEIPEGWTVSSVGEISDKLKAGGTPSTKRSDFYGGDILYVKVEDVVSAGKYLDATDRTITQLGLDESSAWEVPAGALLYTMYASYGVPTITRVPIATNQAIIASIPNPSLVTTNYLYYYLWSIKPTLYKRIRGTTQANLNAGIVRELEVPLPPLNEQRRIVEKIEELFTKLDAGVESLRKTQALLRKYRQSVLKAAVTGELSRKWREEHAEELDPASELLERQPLLSETNSDSHFSPNSLPALWQKAKIGDVFEVHVGATPSRKESSYWNGTIPWVSSGEVAFCRISDTKEKITDTGFRNTSTQLHQPGTVLLGMIGEGKTRGQVAILDIPACHNQNSAAIRVSEAKMSPEYVYYCLQNQYAETRRLGSGNNQPALNKSRVRDISISLPPLPEQIYIAKELDRVLSITDSLEATVDEDLKRSESLRQSILKRAFSGRLVPQDPDDEPASVLLERIREERLTTNQKPKKRRGGKQPETESPSLFPGSDS